MFIIIAKGRLALAPSIGKRLLPREREFVSYVGSSCHVREMVELAMQQGLRSA